MKCMCSTLLCICRGIQRLQGLELTHHRCMLRFKGTHNLLILSLNSLSFFKLVVERRKTTLHFLKALLDCYSQIFTWRIQLQKCVCLSIQGCLLLMKLAYLPIESSDGPSIFFLCFTLIGIGLFQVTAMLLLHENGF